MYDTDHPTAEQIQGALSMLANTAQGEVDYNFGYDVPSVKQAKEFLQTLQREYIAAGNGTLIIPGSGGQQIFFATNDEKNSPYINSGKVDKVIAGVIIKAPIKQPEIAGVNNGKRDPATNLPLDDEGRYAQQISVDGKMHAPKYFPCPTASAGCGGQNLDMSDPGTVAYVKALDKKIFKDIGAAATVVTIASPLGAIGNAASVTGILVTLASTIIDSSLVEGGRELTSQVAQTYLQLVLKIPVASAIRITAIIELAGGWSAFAKRVQTEVSRDDFIKSEK
ncbi:hypothetical protein [Glaciimonas sp. PCH181]|uniref:hypothetical protein n=1 Tax=Glaciimonas sp. PCH181 TaxID=2133943 RepID=UPI000D382F22|nr:hypothetical protein [Glaciimonas sp. PCH181]PUA18093.1 hypothetical protein C7W93_19910 [Glaciimonas sp. PCH181]